jgi:hypothetical protein
MSAKKAELVDVSDGQRFVAGQPVTPLDEHHGKGGMYVVVDGVRVPFNDNNEGLIPDALAPHKKANVKTQEHVTEGADLR